MSEVANTEVALPIGDAPATSKEWSDIMNAIVLPSELLELEPVARQLGAISQDKAALLFATSYAGRDSL